MGGNKKTGFLSMASAYWCIGIALTNQTGSWSECVLGYHVGAMCFAELSTCTISRQRIVNKYIGVWYKWFTCGWRELENKGRCLAAACVLCASMYTTKLQPRRTAKLLITAMIPRLLFSHFQLTVCTHRRERTEVM